MMKRLESRQHLIQIKLSRGRNTSPAALAAEQRRLQNPDLHEKKLKQLLPELLLKFSELIPDEWQSFPDLIRKVYRYDLASLHGPVSQDDERRFQQLLEERVKSCLPGTDPITNEVHCSGSFSVI